MDNYPEHPPPLFWKLGGGLYISLLKTFSVIPEKLHSLLNLRSHFSLVSRKPDWRVDINSHFLGFSSRWEPSHNLETAKKKKNHTQTKCLGYASDHPDLTSEFLSGSTETGTIEISIDAQILARGQMSPVSLPGGLLPGLKVACPRHLPGLHLSPLDRCREPP